uniref:Uncharacterized protein n=1 Tax=Anguilla anguilla TaxID=7936 RepID=A0A0E9V3X8_ANGAN
MIPRVGYRKFCLTVMPSGFMISTETPFEIGTRSGLTEKIL